VQDGASSTTTNDYALPVRIVEVLLPIGRQVLRSVPLVVWNLVAVTVIADPPRATVGQEVRHSSGLNG
jgi:hypothetical protein